MGLVCRNDAARGGSAWGAGTLANGDGSRQPSEVELAQAKFQVWLTLSFSASVSRLASQHEHV